MQLESILREKFGLADFRLGQKEIIDSVLAGQDVLAVLPTGGGKSLCFQIPAVAQNKIVIVISPLIALMKDQVANLRKKGIAAGSLHSGQSDDDKREVFNQMKKGGAFLLYLSPERAQKEGFQIWVRTQQIALFAIDEAHCVSQWGHDFREEYGQLKVLKSLRPDVPILALTASATPLVLNDIARNLSLKNPSKHVHGFYRPNLYYQVESCASEELKYQFLTSAIKAHPEGRVLVYCGTRKLTEEVAAELQKDFKAVDCYHAGLGTQDRNQKQKSFSDGGVRILVATNAFGMGIDHPDVRLVVHFNMPANIDALYQEMGRAGRDGNHSTCLMLWSGKDKGLQSYFIQSSEAPAEIKRSRWNTLNAIVDYAEGGECRHSEILTYYKDAQRIKRCGHCDICDPGSQRRVVKPAFVVTVKLKKKVREVVGEKPLNDMELMRYELLRDWRKAKANELDVPAFVVFSDKTLRHIAQSEVSSTEDLKNIHGIGEHKLEKFGTDILRTLGI